MAARKPSKRPAPERSAAKRPAAKRPTSKKVASKRMPAKGGTPRKAAAGRTAPRKGAAKKAATRKTVGAKAAPEKTASRKAPAKRTAAKRPAAKKVAARKPAFGRPGTAGKAEGGAAVRAWMEGVKPGHRPLVERLDALIADVVPDVKRAVKWSMPTYGREGQGFFASVASFKEHVRLSFFEGASLAPPPPEGEGKGMRAVNLRGTADYDEAQLRSWIRQAASRKGWGKA